MPPDILFSDEDSDYENDDDDDDEEESEEEEDIKDIKAKTEGLTI
jgi:hypothetical protein